MQNPEIYLRTALTNLQWWHTSLKNFKISSSRFLQLILKKYCWVHITFIIFTEKTQILKCVYVESCTQVGWTGLPMCSVLYHVQWIETSNSLKLCQIVYAFIFWHTVSWFRCEIKDQEHFLLKAQIAYC